MYRLPDTIYTEEVIDGVPAQLGFKQESPSFIQGEDLEFRVFLQYNQSPVVPALYNLKAVVKKLPQAEAVLWSGEFNQGIYTSKVPGFVSILIPSEVTSLMYPGTYYMDVVLTEKLGTGGQVKDVSKVLLSFTFNIELGASSPNPKLSTRRLAEATFNPTAAEWTFVYHSVEPTLPAHEDTSTVP